MCVLMRVLQHDIMQATDNEPPAKDAVNYYLIKQRGEKTTVITKRFIIKSMAVKQRLQCEPQCRIYVFQQQVVVWCLLWVQTGALLSEWRNKNRNVDYFIRRDEGDNGRTKYESSV